MAEPPATPPPAPSPDIINKVAQAYKDANDNAQELLNKRQIFNLLDVDINNVAGALGKLSLGVFGSTKAFTQFGASAKVMSSFAEQMANAGKMGSVADAAVTKMLTAIHGTSKIGGMAASAIAALGKNMIEGADNALSFEGGLLSIAGASGLMGRTFEQAGTNLINMNQLLETNASNMANISTATNSSLETVSANWSLLGKAVPESVSRQVDATNAAGEKTNMLEASMKLAAGTGQSFESVVSSLTTAWETYGLEGQKALEFTNEMSQLSDKFHINLSYTTKYLTDNANAYAIVSNEATNAGQTFNRMFNSFREGGLSAKQSSEMIGGLTTRMAGLTIGQKAFLSAQTGGPGGLRGAYQIDNLLRQGKTDEVLKKVEENFRSKAGGKIYTQEEAGQSDYAAAQFTRQRQMLQSGAFGNLVEKGPQGDAKASRILEAWAKGTSASTALASPKDSVQENINRGVEIQKQSNNIAIDTLREARKQTVLAEINSLDKIQKYMGSSEKDRKDVDSFITKQADYLNNRQTAASNLVNTNANALNKNNQFVDAKKEGQDAAITMVDYVKKLLPAGKIQDMFSSMSEQMKNGSFKKDGKFENAMNLLNKEESRIKSNIEKNGNKAGGDDVQKLMNVSAAKAQLTNFMSSGPDGRGLETGRVVENAQVSNKKLVQDKTGTNQAQQKHAQDVNVNIKGLVCEQCYKPLPHNAYAHSVEQGSH